MKRADTLIIILMFLGCFSIMTITRANTAKDSALAENTLKSMDFDVACIPAGTGIETVIKGIEDVETHIILRGRTSPEQSEVVKKILENNLSLLQQHFNIERQRIDSEAELEYLRIFKKFFYGEFFS